MRCIGGSHRDAGVHRTGGSSCSLAKFFMYYETMSQMTPTRWYLVHAADISRIFLVGIQ
jgi:hypothetical protein